MFAAARLYRLTLATLLATGLAACSGTLAAIDFSLESRKELGRQLPVDPDQPLLGRAKPIPPRLLEGWRAADLSMGKQPHRYATHPLSGAERQMLQQALATLPENWQALLRQKLAGIFFVDQLLGGGISDWVVAPDGSVAYTMILNPALFRHTAAEWLDLRENASFAKGPLHLAAGGWDGVSALTYVLWHESAHLLDYERRITPYVEAELRDFRRDPDASSPFTQAVWQKIDEPLPAFDFENRKSLNPYRMNENKPLLPNRDLASLFDAWSRTPFVSLYASGSWTEDLADFAAFRLQAERSGKEPYWELRNGGKSLGRFEPMGEVLNRERERESERIFGAASRVR